MSNPPVSTTTSGVAVLLGAGASIPFEMPTLAEFGASAAVQKHVGNVKWTENNRDLVRFAENLDSYARNTAKPAGIESAIDRIDEYCAFLRSARRDGNCTSHLFPIDFDHHRSERMLELALVVRRILLCQLVKTYSKKIPPNSGKALCDILDVLAARAKPGRLPVFTTNYDTTITQLAGESPKPDLSLKLNLSKDLRIALTRLHGCVEWCYIKDDPDNAYTANNIGDECNHDNQKRVVDSDECMLTCGVSQKNERMADRVVIKTGVINPELKLDRKPFSDAFQLFERSLGECRIICVVGFSFRDREVVNSLARALRNKRCRLVVVDLFLKNEEIARRLGDMSLTQSSIRVISRDLRETMCATELANALD